jgi:hypothetical protein
LSGPAGPEPDCRTGSNSALASIFMSLWQLDSSVTVQQRTFLDVDSVLNRGVVRLVNLSVHKNNLRPWPISKEIEYGVTVTAIKVILSGNKITI